MDDLAAASTQCLNISKDREDLLLWHNIFGHFDIRSIQKMMHATNNSIEPIIKPQISTTATCIIPFPRSCLRDKGYKTSLYSTNVTSNIDHLYVIREGSSARGLCEHRSI